MPFSKPSLHNALSSTRIGSGSRGEMGLNPYITLKGVSDVVELTTRL